MTAARFATITELRRAMESRGLRPNRRLGQNFLVDLNLLRFVTDAADLGPQDVALEVGCAAGALTRLLAERAGTVVAAEIDSGLFALAEESLAGSGSVRLVGGDAMGKRGHLAPGLLRELDAALAGHEARRLKLVANLPYGVATAVIKALLVHGPRPATVVVTVQSEVADRMAAEPGHRDYGLLTVLLRAAGEVERLRTLKPGVFWPAPRVQSAVVRVRLDKPVDINPQALLRVAGKMMEQRRKRCAKAMQMAGLAHDSREAMQRLTACGINPDGRPAQVTPEQFVRLARLVGREAP